MPPINLPSGIQLIVLPTSHIFIRISLYYTSLPYSNTELIKVKSIFVMWQQIITSIIYFLAVGVHVTDASCSGGPNRTEFTEYRSFGSVLFGSVRFGEIQKYRTESLLLILSIFKGFRDLLNHFLREK